MVDRATEIAVLFLMADNEEAMYNFSQERLLRNNMR